jgi:hypothetical protein
MAGIVVTWLVCALSAVSHAVHIEPASWVDNNIQVLTASVSHALHSDAALWVGRAAKGVLSARSGSALF